MAARLRAGQGPVSEHNAPLPALQDLLTEAQKQASQGRLALLSRCTGLNFSPCGQFLACSLFLFGLPFACQKPPPGFNRHVLALFSTARGFQPCLTIQTSVPFTLSWSTASSALSLSQLCQYREQATMLAAVAPEHRSSYPPAFVVQPGTGLVEHSLSPETVQELEAVHKPLFDKGWPKRLIFSPSGRFLLAHVTSRPEHGERLSSQDVDMLVVDVHTDKLIARSKYTHEPSARGPVPVAWHPSSRAVVLSGNAALTEAGSMERAGFAVAQLPADCHLLDGAENAFSPDAGHMLARRSSQAKSPSSLDMVLVSLQLEDGRYQLEVQRVLTNCRAFGHGPASRLLVLGTGRAVVDAVTGEEALQLRGDSDVVYSTPFLQLCSVMGTDGHQITSHKVVDLATGQEVWGPHQQQIEHCSWCPSGCSFAFTSMVSTEQGTCPALSINSFI